MSGTLTLSMAQAMVAASQAPLVGHHAGWFSEATREHFNLATIRRLSDRKLMFERRPWRGRMTADLTMEGRRQARLLASVVAAIAAARGATS